MQPSTDATSFSSVAMDARNAITRQIGDATIILANGHKRFSMLLKRLKHIAIVQINYGITDIVADIILLRLIATL